MMDALAGKCYRVGLDVNVAKTVYTTFGNRKRSQTRPLVFSGKPIPFEKDVIVYLGGHMCRNGSVMPHLKNRDTKAQRALGATMQIWARYPYMTLQFKTELADTLVGPVLVFASEVWCWGR